MRHGDVGIHARACFEELVHRPSLPLISADFHTEVFAVAAFARIGSAMFLVEVVWIGEENEILPSVVIAHDTAHADGFEQRLVKLWRTPARDSIIADGDEAAMCLRFAAHVEHHTTVVEFDGHSFIGIDPFVRARHGDVTRLPRLALVITVDRRGDAGAMGIATGARGKPHGHHKTTACKLNAVIRPGGEHSPVVVPLEGIKRCGDLGRLAPRHAIVVAALVEAAHVFKAEEHMHRAALVGDEHRVVVGHVVGIDVLHAHGEGALLFHPFDTGNALRRAPRFPFIATPAQQNANIIPIADTSGVLPCFAPGEHGSLRGDDDAGDVVELIGGIVADGKNILFFDEGLGGSTGTDQNKKECREDESLHD